MWIMWIDFKSDISKNCYGCDLRHSLCHSHCPHGISQALKAEERRMKLYESNQIKYYEKDAVRRMRRLRSSTGMRVV